MQNRAVISLCGLLTGIALFVPHTGRGEVSLPLTMERAVEFALERNLALRSAEAELELARGTLLGARIVTSHNPELSSGAALRLGQDASSVDAFASVGQTFLLGRPRQRRIAAGVAAREMAQERLTRLQFCVSSQARIAYVAAIAARQTVVLAREAESLTGDLHQLARDRLNADAGTELELNLAALEWAQARRILVEAISEEQEARLELARVLTLPTDRVLLPAKLPQLGAPITTPVEELVKRALEQRPDLAAVERQQERAQAELEVALAEAAPELTLEASYEFEEQDHVVGVGLSIPLPIFARNQGEIAEARARTNIAELDVQSARLAVEHEVRAAFQRYESAQEMAEVLGQEMIELSADNLALLRASYEEGNVGFVEVLLVQRELIATQRHAVQAAVNLFRAQEELNLAVGAEVQ